MDHAVEFLGRNWLVLVDPFSKYPCIHPTGSISTQATIDLLEEDFAHFGYPHALVMDNAPSFTSGEFKAWCQSRGITHLTGAPYHPATNGTAERMVQSFKQSMRKSSLPPKRALQEFLMQYRRTPLAFGLSPSELLNGRQIRTKIDALWPEPAHWAQGKQATETTKSQQGKLKRPVRSVDVRVVPQGPTWRRHIEQLRPRHESAKDADPEEPNLQEQEAPVLQTPSKGNLRRSERILQRTADRK